MSKPQEFSLEGAAADLLALIQMVQRKTGAPRVHLVAHSMGGLICRCLIQKVIPDLRRDGALDQRAEDYVDRLFTYATPYGASPAEPARQARREVAQSPAPRIVW